MEMTGLDLGKMVLAWSCVHFLESGSLMDDRILLSAMR